MAGDGGPVVVVGCDGRPDSDVVLRFAAEEASCRGARLVVVAAYDAPIDPDLQQFDSPDAERASQARARVGAACARVGVSRPVDIEVAAGDPVAMLLRHAEPAALIVIGSHQRGFARRLLGHGTARRLLHDAAVPVTVVPTARGRAG